MGHGLAAECGLEAGHEQRGGDAFAGDIADGEGEDAGVELEEIVGVTTDAASGAAVAPVVQVFDGREVLREEALLHFLCDFHFAVQAFALGDGFGDGGGELAVFERQAGLRGDALQQAEVIAGVGFFAALATETDEAE